MISNRLYIIIFVAILWTGCQNGQELNKELALQELELKIELYKQRKMEDCKAEAIREAEVIVDSIIQSSTFAPIKNQNYNPAIPTKPSFIPVDSSVFKSQNSVKPIKESF